MVELKMPPLPPRAVDTDEALVTRAQSGERDAFDELFRRHLNHARLVARQMMPNDYEDVVQDACLKAMEAIAQCRGAFGGWFMMIVRHQAINRYREGKRMRDTAEPIETLGDVRVESDFEVSEPSAELMLQLARVFRALSPTQREVLAAVYAEANQGEDGAALLKRAAARLHKSEGAVRNALFQARRVLNERAPEGLLETIVAKSDRGEIVSVVCQAMLA